MTTLADVIIPDDGDDKTATQSDDATKATSQNKQNDGLPEKFRGKSTQDVVEAYLNLEREHGRVVNDLGEQRRLTDRLLDLDQQKRASDLQRNGGDPAELPEVTTDDLLTRPGEVIGRLVDARVKAALEPTNQRVTSLEAGLTQSDFRRAHADADAIANSPEFLAWVQKSPLRLRAAQAANQGNWTAANDLMSEYKAQHLPTTSTSSDDNSTGDDLEAARQASLETSGSAGGKNGADGKPQGQLYSRAKLIRLRIENPDEYYDEAFQEKIQRAHAEGRVR